MRIVDKICSKLKTKLIYSLFLKEIGKRSIIYKPLKLTNLQNITIKERVQINEFVWLFTFKVTDKDPQLVIDSGANIGHFNHIACINEVYIGKNVLTGDKVYISDHQHSYEDIAVPVNDQPLVSKGKVYIGEHTWIGENVSILSCRIGKHCVIGANSVVNKDIPDYSVAVGAPAKVVKRYDLHLKRWVTAQP
ncbi:MAG: acyltransferase [bacterium]|nr:acyltransferase [bacterium]